MNGAPRTAKAAMERAMRQTCPNVNSSLLDNFFNGNEPVEQYADYVEKTFTGKLSMVKTDNRGRSHQVRATKRPSNCIVREPVITLPPWSESSSTRIRFIIIRRCRSMLELRLTRRNPRAVGFQSIRFDPPVYYFLGLRISIGNGSEFSIVGTSRAYSKASTA